MATEIWRDFDPNLDIPEELKNVRVLDLPEQTSTDSVDIQFDPDSDDDSDLDEDSADDVLGVPSYLTVISQTVRTAPGGNQVIDVVIDVEDIPGAEDYDFRISK